MGLRPAADTWALAALAMVLASLLAMSLFSASGAAQASSSRIYELHIDCPELAVIYGVDRNEILCPVRAEDPDDIMGSPSIAVDPEDPANLVLGSLHGGDGHGPTDRSRAGPHPAGLGSGWQPFTTFVSTSHGADWQDRPYYAPQKLGESFGEHVQVAIDERGSVFIGSLYATPRYENAGEPRPAYYDYTIVAQKFDSMGQVEAQQTMYGDFGSEYIDPTFGGNVIPEFWFVREPGKDRMALVWYERPPEGEPSGDTLATGLGFDAADEDPFARSVIALGWTTSDWQEPWHWAPQEYLVGPCEETSNPVIRQGMVYIACRIDVDEGGYAYGESPVEGQIDLFRMNLTTGEPEHLGRTPLTHGQPRLALRTDGRLALTTAGVGPDGRTQLNVAFGVADMESPTAVWGDQFFLGDEVTASRPGVRVTEARVQDIVMREDSGSVHLILKEQYQNLGLVLDDPTALAQARYVKQLIAIHEDDGVLAQIDLDIGNPVNRTSFAGRHDPNDPDQERVYNDMTDDILLFDPGQLPPAPYDERVSKFHPDDYQREFIAVADYGEVIFAEVIEITDAQAGAVGFQASIIPITSPAIAAQFVAAGVATTALAGLLALKLALGRSKSPSVAVTKGGK